ncbi:maltose/maltodextrinABC transporter substrate-binding protein MalE [Klebsiella oxytoca]|nr:maltose/maltodextrinABC transporter substrate-binding protein MalE [Klebsiella oxytoca]
MKKNTLAALILTTLAAGQLTSLQAYAAGQLNVWGRHQKIRWHQSRSR